MKKTKRIFTYLLFAALLFSCLPHAFAAETAVVAEETYTQIDSLPESSLLYDEYLRQMFYPNASVSFLGESAREQLGPLGQKLYDFLKTNIQKIASGESASTVLTLSESQISEWGGTTTYSKSSTQTVDEAAMAAMRSLSQEMAVEYVIDALLHDCPYELYWYDKVSGVTQSAACNFTESEISITSITFRFSVVADMQTADYNPEDPEFDTSNVVSAVTASENALSIVAQYEAQTDYQKLLGYKNEICSLVSYNHAAASMGNFSEDADPWQLIYVFDEDPSTNVVCEGYSKAFQYLFDLTDFAGNVDCITVVGDSSGEGHMWNIVSIGSVHYLTDITNSDAETVGADGGLFLAGASGSIQDGYQAKGLLYTYRDSTVHLWGSDASSPLNISADAYPCTSAHTEVPDPAVPATCDTSGLTAGSHCSVCNQILTAQEIIPALEHDMGAWETTKESSCTEEGSQIRYCTREGCNYSETEAIPSVGSHTFTDDKDPTCNLCDFTRTVTAETVPVYRLYNPFTQEHLLTSGVAEKDALIRAGWTLDGIAWNAPINGQPVYRLYNPYDDWHTYTTSLEEIDILTPLGWTVDGIVSASAESDQLPIYRLFNPYVQTNYHLLTASTAERDLLVIAGWILEGVAWYGLS